MSDNMTKRAKEYMNADFVYEDYKNLAEAQKIADVEDVTAISERLIKQNNLNEKLNSGFGPNARVNSI